MVPGLGDSLRAYVYALIEDEDGQGPTRQAVDGVLVTLIVLSVGADILGTVKSIHEEWYALIRSIDVVSTLAFTIEYIVRLWVCVEDRDGRYNRPVLGRMRYAVTPLAIADLMAILPFYLYFLLPDELRLLRLFRLMRVLKLARYSPALRVIEVVLLNQRQPLLAALSVVAVLLIISSGLMYFAEHQAQPEAFGSIPAAMWWAAVTMSGPVRNFVYGP